MPLNPFHSETVTLKKSPRYGAETFFSTGKKEEKIVAWEVWNSRMTRQVAAQSKMYNDETTLVLRTHNSLAKELQPEDAVVYGGYSYSVQTARPVKTALGIATYDYEIQVK